MTPPGYRPQRFGIVITGTSRSNPPGPSVAFSAKATGTPISPTSSGGALEAPFLSVRNQPDDAALDSLVSGTLRVNENDCVVLDDSLVSAPMGSAVLNDGRGVVFAGIGEYRFGDQLSVRGMRAGPTDIQTSERCGVKDVAVLYSSGSS